MASEKPDNKTKRKNNIGKPNYIFDNIGILSEMHLLNVMKIPHANHIGPNGMTTIMKAIEKDCSDHFINSIFEIIFKARIHHVNDVGDTAVDISLKIIATIAADSQPYKWKNLDKLFSILEILSIHKVKYNFKTATSLFECLPFTTLHQISKSLFWGEFPKFLLEHINENNWNNITAYLLNYTNISKQDIVEAVLLLPKTLNAINNSNHEIKLLIPQFLLKHNLKMITEGKEIHNNNINFDLLINELNTNDNLTDKQQKYLFKNIINHGPTDLFQGPSIINKKEYRFKCDFVKYLKALGIYNYCDDILEPYCKTYIWNDDIFSAFLINEANNLFGTTRLMELCKILLNHDENQTKLIKLLKLELRDLHIPGLILHYRNSPKHQDALESILKKYIRGTPTDKMLFHILNVHQIEFSEKLIAKIITELGKNYKNKESITDNAYKLACKYCNMYPKNDTIMIDGIYKLLTLDKFIDNMNKFPIDNNSLSKLINIHKKCTTLDIKKIFNKISESYTEDAQVVLQKYLYTNYNNVYANKNLFDIDELLPLTRNIRFDIEWIGELIISRFDFSTRRTFGLQDAYSPLEYFVKLLVTTKNPEYTLFIDKLIKETPNINLHNKLPYYEITQCELLDDDTKRLLLNNVDNLPRYLYGNYNSSGVIINALNPLKSVTKHIQNSKLTGTQWIITYKNQSGYDAGGLIRDFYYILGDQIKQQMGKIDNYYYINDKTKGDSNLWFTIGLMFGKMFAIERLPCGINLHPYLLYRITHPEFEQTKTITFESEWYGDDESLNTICKLTKLTEGEWKEYCALNDIQIDYDQVANYCSNEILRIYEDKFQPGLTEFINGFWSYGDSTLVKYINGSFLSKKICGSLEYKILGKGNTLESKLNYTRPNKYVDTILKVLDNLSRENNERLQKFFRFWFGSPYIDFMNHTIRLSYGTKKNVCEAHTCSFELVIPRKDGIDNKIMDDDDALYRFCSEIIENTLNNQTLADEFNLHTQYK